MRIAALLALVPAVAAAQPLPATWSVDTPKDAPATLIYGPPGAPSLGFACVRKTGQITVRLADHKAGEVWINGAGIAEPWPASVAFASADAAATLRGQAHGTDGAGTAVTTEISTAAPVMKGFGKTGAIALTALSETATPVPAKPGMVRKFLGVCD